ncbi:MAG: hypothetical protein OJF62_001743 [Pseudolabrys sp.]|nr:hypothetical protein [Pseudolabrys sp.]
MRALASKSGEGACVALTRLGPFQVLATLSRKRERENENTPEGASRCRAGASSLKGPVGGLKSLISCENGPEIRDRP